MRKLMMTALAAVGILTASAREKVFFFVAHPDDTLACAGTMFLMKDKFELHVMVLTHGERGCGEAGYRDGSTKAKRTREEEEAEAMVGAKVHWFDEVDGDCYANREVCRKVADLLKELKPRAVIGHYPVDIHPDHVMSGAALLRALANVSTKDYKPEVYFFDQPYQTKAYHPDFFLDVSEVFDQKLALMKSYFSQGWGHKYFDPGVSNMEEANEIKAKAYAERAKREADPAYRPNTKSLHRSTCAAYFYAMRTSDLNQGARVEPYVSMFPRQQGQLTIFDQLPQGPRRFNSRFQGAKVGQWAN